MKIFRIRFVDGSQIDFRNVTNEEDTKDLIRFNYDDCGIGNVKINIIKNSIVFLIEMKGEK